MSDEKNFFQILSEEIDGWLSPQDLRTLRNGEADEGTMADFSKAIKKAKAQRLNPFEDHVYFEKNYDKNTDGGRVVLTLGVTIAGLRMIAQSTDEYAGQKGPLWCGKDGQWRDVWLEDEPPAAAKVGILRHSFAEPLWSVARWSDYAKTYKSGDAKAMWASMGPHMLAKCAEANGLRRAFPDRTAELYTPEEMEKRRGGQANTSAKAGGDGQAGGNAPSQPSEKKLDELNKDFGIPTGQSEESTESEAQMNRGEWDGQSRQSNASETPQDGPGPANGGKPPNGTGDQGATEQPAQQQPQRGDTITTGEDKDDGSQGQLGFLFYKGVHDGPYTKKGLRLMIEEEFDVEAIDQLLKSDFDAAKSRLENEQMAQRYNDKADGKDQTRDMFDAGGEPADERDPELDFGCPYCGADEGDPCRTDSGNEKSGYHQARTERFQAAAGNVEAFASRAKDALMNAESPDDVVAAIAVEIADWPKGDWNAVVDALDDVHESAREECELRRTPEFA